MKTQKRFIQKLSVMLASIVMWGCAGEPIIGTFEAHSQRVQPGESLKLKYSYIRAYDGARIHWFSSGNRKNFYLLKELPKGDQRGEYSFTPSDMGRLTYELEVENSWGSSYSDVFITVFPTLKLTTWSSNRTTFRPNQMIQFNYDFIGAEEAYIEKKIGNNTKKYSLDTKNGGRSYGQEQISFQTPATYFLVIKNSYDPDIKSNAIQTTLAP